MSLFMNPNLVMLTQFAAAALPLSEGAEDAWDAAQQMMDAMPPEARKVLNDDTQVFLSVQTEIITGIRRALEEENAR